MNGSPTDLRMDVGHLADSSVARVGVDAPVGEVADSMLSRSRCARYVVVEDDGRLAGIVTDRDLITATLTTDGEASLLAPDRSGDDVRAEEVMTSDPLTVAPDAEIPRVLRRMNEAAARHVPVVDDGAVVGMITLDDLVRHVAGESVHVAAQLDNLAGVIRAESSTA